jgi:hypothetical protein
MTKRSIYRRVCRIAESAYYLQHICLSICPSAYSSTPPNGKISLKEKIDTGDLYRENLNLFKIEQTYWAIYIRTYVGFLVPVDIKLP